MTLKETLKRLNQNIKLGAGGGGFIYCGQSADIECDVLDKRNIVKRSNSITNGITKVRQAKDRLKDPTKSCGRYAVHTADLGNTPVSFEKWQERQHKEIETELDKIDRNVAELIAYKKVAERKVTEMYKSIDEENTVIIIVEGTDAGGAWTTEEYRDIERSWNETFKGR